MVLDSQLPPVQSFWFGPVSTMERLSVASFLANGHEVQIYAYDDIGDALPGAAIRDAREIIPKRRSVFRDSRKSYAGFADHFRYKLLLERGGWWVDLDTVCVRPFDLTDDYVFATEHDLTIANGIMRVPPGSDVMRQAWDAAGRLGRDRKRWGAAGPRLLAEAVTSLGLDRHAVDHRVFLPLAWEDWEQVIDGSWQWEIGPDTRSFHLWSAMWAKSGRDKNATYAPECLYEQLKRRYLDG